ncbi:MAG: hypothetical protein Ta2D_06980 [Rickettsiales bacterium]|nr:MAG: hypothetical protein Ta2D_06980 [Rickettsiales bacterium]
MASFRQEGDVLIPNGDIKFDSNFANHQYIGGVEKLKIVKIKVNKDINNMLSVSLEGKEGKEYNLDPNSVDEKYKKEIMDFYKKKAVAPVKKEEPVKEPVKDVYLDRLFYWGELGRYVSWSKDAVAHTHNFVSHSGTGHGGQRDGEPDANYDIPRSENKERLKITRSFDRLKYRMEDKYQQGFGNKCGFITIVNSPAQHEEFLSIEGRGLDFIDYVSTILWDKENRLEQVPSPETLKIREDVAQLAKKRRVMDGIEEKTEEKVRPQRITTPQTLSNEIADIERGLKVSQTRSDERVAYINGFNPVYKQELDAFVKEQKDNLKSQTSRLEELKNKLFQNKNLDANTLKEMQEVVDKSREIRRDEDKKADEKLKYFGSRIRLNNLPAPEKAKIR